MTAPCDQRRRDFLAATGVALSGLVGLSGCSTLSGDDDQPDAPDYDWDVVSAVHDTPAPPRVFPVDVERSWLAAHESRARTLLDSVPVHPDLPNEYVATRIGRDRENLLSALDAYDAESLQRETLDRWRYYRASAAEVWGANGLATGDYTRADHRNRLDSLRSAYDEFRGTWQYRGADPATALVLHTAIEELLARGEREMLDAGPFPDDPQASVFQHARIVEATEWAAAVLADARRFRAAYVPRDDAPRHRYRFAAAAATIRNRRTVAHRRTPYRRALDVGASALDVDLEDGPAEVAFHEARRFVQQTRDALEHARLRSDPATAALAAGRHMLALRGYPVVVDAIRDGTLDWPADDDRLRRLHYDTVFALHGVYDTDPRPLAVELARYPLDALDTLVPPGEQSDYGDRELGRLVGRLHFAHRLADEVPAVTAVLARALDLD